ncbi:MAG TPA: alpha/beta fold hydrolase [Actinomycetota bacterium]|nr:alpha/beta fold hydrolase [Actinomycetota bacterium]
MTEALTVTSRDGLALEAALDVPDEAKAGLLFCHPHPRFGGTMEAPLIHAVRDEMLRRGWAVLRFNFRGVGASEGESSLGEAEVADARGALDLLATRIEKPIAIAGWSFGGAVAIRTFAQERERVGACVAIAPAVEAKEGIAAGLPPPSELGPLGPLMSVVGVNDEHVSPAAVKTWTEQVPDARFVSISAANHFFWARYTELATTVGDWLDMVV